MKRETKNALLCLFFFLFCALVHFCGTFKIPWDDPYSPGFTYLPCFPSWLAGLLAGGLLLGFGAVRKKLLSSPFFPCLLLSASAMFLLTWGNFRESLSEDMEWLGLWRFFDYSYLLPYGEQGKHLLPVCGNLSGFLLGAAAVLGVGSVIHAILHREFRQLLRPRLFLFGALALPWAAGYADQLVLLSEQLGGIRLYAEYPEGGIQLLLQSIVEDFCRWLPMIILFLAACAAFYPLLEKLPVYGRAVSIGMTWLILLDLVWAFPSIIIGYILPWHSHLYLTVHSMIYDTVTSWPREVYALLCGAALSITLQTIRARRKSMNASNALQERGHAGCHAVRMTFLRGIVVPLVLVPAVFIAGSASNLWYPTRDVDVSSPPYAVYVTDSPAYPVGTKEISLTLESPPDMYVTYDSPDLQRWYHGKWYQVKAYNFIKLGIARILRDGVYHETVTLKNICDPVAMRPGRYRFVRNLRLTSGNQESFIATAEFEIVR